MKGLMTLLCIDKKIIRFISEKKPEKIRVFRLDFNSCWSVSDLTERGSAYQMDRAAHVKDLSPYFAR
jgi:hypothetical protein